MDCNAAREQLGPYLDDELDADARGGVEAHLAGCPACGRELERLNALAADLAAGSPTAVPDGLWSSIKARLDEAKPADAGQRAGRMRLGHYRGPLAAAAGVVLVVGLGLLGLSYMNGGAPEAEASAVDFGVLLDALPKDAKVAFREFLERHGAAETTAADALRHAAQLNFATPESLPGGFRLQAVYALQFGDSPGIAAEYSRDGEFLGAIFHPPVRREDFGTHKDLPCAVGMHRGHSVQVGSWRLVHLTDPTTCHCVLSQLDTNTELPEVMAAVAPQLPPDGGAGHDH
ncbi:MAG TPA: anti-sigma factor [Phycisphaerae bacterium]|nr:anti-sigma factor [Phycisphaerae bacterium]